MLLLSLLRLLSAEAICICMREGQLHSLAQYLDTNLLGLWKRLEMPLPLLRKEIELSLPSMLPVGTVLTAVGTVLTALEALRALA